MVEPIGKGVSKDWTPQAEELWAKRLMSCSSFAESHVAALTRDLLKYDGRTKEAKRAISQARLRLVTATDEDLEEVAKLESEMPQQKPHRSIAEIVEELQKVRANIREKGISKSELTCQ